MRRADLMPPESSCLIGVRFSVRRAESLQVCPPWAGRIAKGLHKSQLLFRRFRSTIPGLREIRYRCSRRQGNLRERARSCEIPDAAEDFGAGRPAAFFALDEVLNATAERVNRGVVVAPGVTQTARVKWV